jgi:hypothetical protein
VPLTLNVDGDRWRRHLRRVATAHAGIVPVAKGNGYGLGVARLARKAAWLGVDTIAVGTYEDVQQVLPRFDGDVLVMAPWRAELAHLLPEGSYDRRVVHTLGRLSDVVALAAHRQPDRYPAPGGGRGADQHGQARADATRAVGRSAEPRAAAPGGVRRAPADDRRSAWPRRSSGRPCCRHRGWTPRRCSSRT